MGRYRLRDAALAVVIVLALSACAGGARLGPAAVTPGTSTPAGQLSPGGLDFDALGALPQDPPLTDSAIRAKRAEALVFWRYAGNDTFSQHSDCVADAAAGTLALTSAPQLFQWAIYQFPLLLQDDKTLGVTVEQAGIAQPFYLGIADYGRQRWEWHCIAAPTGVDQYILPDNLDCINAGGAMYAAVVACGGSAITLQAVSLLSDMQAPPPQDCSASDGARGDGVQLSWTDPAVSYSGLSYDRIIVERSAQPAGPWTAIGQALAGVTSYLDRHEGSGAGEHNVPYATPLYYRLRVRAGTQTGFPGPADSGFRHFALVDGVSATDGVYPDKVVVAWNAAPGASAYDVEYKQSSQSEALWTPLATVAGAELEYSHRQADTNHPCLYNTSYDYRVRARHLADTGPGWSNVDAGFSFANAAPVAALTADPAYGLAPLSVSFDASGSYDPDGLPLARYQWDWYNDGGYDFDSGTNSTVTHVYAAEGLYTCRVTVTDALGSQAAAVAHVTADVQRYTASGYVLNDDGLGIAGVTLDFFGGAGNATTDISGHWSRDNLRDGNYQLRPLKDWFSFTPVNRSLSVAGADLVVDDFIGAENRLKWSVAGPFGDSSPVVGAAGTIYLGAGKDLCAINPDGAPQWSYTTGDSVESSPASGADGTVYVGSNDLFFYALNPDGTLKWKYETDGLIASSPTVGEDGTVYVGCGDHNLYAFHPDGSLAWTYDTGWWIGSSPALGVDGTIYIGSDDCRLHAVNPDGTLQWTYATGDWITAKPAVASDGAVYVGSYDDSFYAINPDGALRWAFPTTGNVTSSAAVYPDGTVYIGCGNKLNALLSDGSLLWSYAVLGGVGPATVMGRDGTLYLTAGEYIYAMHADGALRWKFDTNHALSSAPGIAPDGTVYVAAGGRLYAFWP